MMRKIYGLVIWFGLLMYEMGVAQPFSLKVSLHNQPDQPVVLGKVSGDDFIPVDTITLHGGQRNGNDVSPSLRNSEYSWKSMEYAFPLSAATGMYRLILGQTTYARVMGEPAQSLDFLFNQENIELTTDFKYPEDSLVIIHSEENKFWFDFLKQERNYKKQLSLKEKEIDFFRAKVAELKSTTGAESEKPEKLEAQVAKMANEFNQLQLDHDRFILQLAENHKNLFASRLIPIFREPFLDGFLSEKERNYFFQQEYLRQIDFSDQSFMHSSVLTDKIFGYLVTYNQRDFNQEQRENAYIKAVDEIMKHLEATSLNDDRKMTGFVLNYLVNGFEKLNMENVLKHIADHYLTTHCENVDEKSTWIRKLEAQRMNEGKVVPDFTLNNLRGEPVTFSRVAKPDNLIIFWASWCPHCMEMLPLIKTWYAQKHTSDMQIIAISLDHSKKDWQEAISRMEIEEFLHLSDLMEWDGQVTQHYNIYATPTMFLVDQQRKILFKPLTVSDLYGLPDQ